MGILSRFGDIISSNINALLDKAEDPEKLCEQYLIHAKEDFAKVKEETAAVMAEEKRCKELVDNAQAEVDKWDDYARKAVTRGEDEDAKTFLAKKQEAVKRLQSVTPTYETAQANAQKMRQMHDKLAKDIQDLEARRNNVKATMAVARTQERVNKAGQAMTGANGAMDAFGRMEEKAKQKLNQATAAAELSEGPVDEATRLAEKYGPASDASVEDELAKLKAELGK